jgi:hypothetical protein
MRPRSLIAPMVVTALAASPALAAATTVLRQDGIGPLKLGMSTAAALKTGWLAHRGKGCELDASRPIFYTFTGRHAPAGLRGSANFRHGKLDNIAVSHGARTGVGVTVGVTSARRMTQRYRALGFTATMRFESVFQATFVTVTRHHKPVIGGLAEGSTITQLAIPSIQVCE